MVAWAPGLGCGYGYQFTRRARSPSRACRSSNSVVAGLVVAVVLKGFQTAFNGFGNLNLILGVVDKP